MTQESKTTIRPKKHADEIAYVEQLLETKKFPIWKRPTDIMLNRIINALEGIENAK